MSSSRTASQEAETTALRLFSENGIEATPRVVAEDKTNNCVLMEWIEGKPVDDFGINEIGELAAFIQVVDDVAEKQSGQDIRHATEACLNGSEIVRQISLRLSRLDASKDQYPELRAFIDEGFIPVFNEISDWSQKQYKHSGLNFSENISFKQQTLSLVDVGCHNVLRKDDKLYFLDFEFFGWDDPVKLVADTLQHPGMVLDEEKKQALRSSLVKIFEKDEMFVTRLKLLYPLFGLKWCMIMLNPFQPGYQLLASSADAQRDQQLKRVRNLMKSILKNPDMIQCYKLYIKVSTRKYLLSKKKLPP